MQKDLLARNSQGENTHGTNTPQKFLIQIFLKENGNFKSSTPSCGTVGGRNLISSRASSPNWTCVWKNFWMIFQISLRWIESRLGPDFIPLNPS